MWALYHISFVCHCLQNAAASHSILSTTPHFSCPCVGGRFWNPSSSNYHRKQNLGNVSSCWLSYWLLLTITSSLYSSPFLSLIPRLPASVAAQMEPNLLKRKLCIFAKGSPCKQHSMRQNFWVGFLFAILTTHKLSNFPQTLWITSLHVWKSLKVQKSFAVQLIWWEPLKQKEVNQHSCQEIGNFPIHAFVAPTHLHKYNSGAMFGSAANSNATGKSGERDIIVFLQEKWSLGGYYLDSGYVNCSWISSIYNKKNCQKVIRTHAIWWKGCTRATWKANNLRERSCLITRNFKQGYCWWRNFKSNQTMSFNISQ